MKTLVIVSALILGSSSLVSASSLDKEPKKANTVVAIDLLPSSIEVTEELPATINNSKSEKVQYTPEQKASIVGLEFRSTSR